MSDKTYSEAEVQALVQAEVAKVAEPLRKELDEFKNSEETKANEAKVAEARAEAEEQIKDLQSKLDEAVLKAEAATKDKDEILAWLETEKTTAEEAEAREARKEERVAKVAEVASFPEDYVTENADRWTALDDEAFEALLQDYKTVAEKASSKKEEVDSKIPAQTAMKAARETDSGKGVPAYREVFSFRGSGIDPRTL